MNLLQERSLHWGCLECAGVEVSPPHSPGGASGILMVFGREQKPHPCILIMRKTDVNEEEIGEGHDRKKRAL